MAVFIFCNNSLSKHQTWGFCEVFFCSGFGLGKSCATKFHNVMHVYSNSVPNGMKASKEMRELTEMPTSGDLKSGDYLFFTTPPPRFQRRPPHPPPQGQIDPAPMGMAQDIIWSLTWGTYYQTLRPSFWCQSNHCQWLNMGKNAPEAFNCTTNKKNSNFEEKMA